MEEFVKSVLAFYYMIMKYDTHQPFLLDIPHDKRQMNDFILIN